MEENSLSIALGDSLKEDTVACISDLVEVGLDAIIDDGILKDIPLFSTAISVYKIGNSIKDRHNIKKLAVFLNEINNRIANEEKRAKYRQKIQENAKFRTQELEYILVLIDRYINYDKPKMLAKLYLAYLDDTIIWEELTMYSEIIDRLFLLDYNILKAVNETINVHRNIGIDSILRLEALGLVADTTNMSPFEEYNDGSLGMTWESLKKYQTNDKKYKRTESGNILVSILNGGE